MNDEIKDEYDFSKAERGRFYRKTPCSPRRCTD
jgi:hypothetical protein